MIDPVEAPVPVVQSHLAMWLAFATPLSVGILSMIQIWFNSKFGKKINEIHAFTNSTLGAARRSEAVAWRTLALQTHDPVDVRKAIEAEAVANEHDAVQLAMEKKEGYVRPQIAKPDLADK